MESIDVVRAVLFDDADDVRSPVKIDAIEIAVVTPMMIPRTVRKLRNLCARTLSSAIRNVSLRKSFGNFMSTIFLVSRQRDDGIQSRGFKGRVYPRNDSDAT
jgi:hypothetical protein